MRCDEQTNFDLRIGMETGRITHCCSFRDWHWKVNCSIEVLYYRDDHDDDDDLFKIIRSLRPLIYCCGLLYSTKQNFMTMNPNPIKRLSWMSGWNAISAIRLDSNKKLWLIVDEDPRPKKDRARHMTSQVYTYDEESHFQMTDALTTEDMNFVLANVYQQDHGQVAQNTTKLNDEIKSKDFNRVLQRFDLAGIHFNGLTFTCCSLMATVTAFTKLPKTLPFPHNYSNPFDHAYLLLASTFDKREYQNLQHKSKVNYWQLKLRKYEQAKLHQKYKNLDFTNTAGFRNLDDGALLPDSMFESTDDGCIRYNLLVAARSFVHDETLNDNYADDENDDDDRENILCSIPDFMESWLISPHDGVANDMNKDVCFDPRFIGFTVSLAQRFVGAQLRFVQTLCIQLVYALYVKVSLTIDEKVTEELHNCLVICLTQLKILMLIKWVLKQRHRRDGQNITSTPTESDSQTNDTDDILESQNACKWMSNSVTAVEAFWWHQPDEFFMQMQYMNSGETCFLFKGVETMINQLLPVHDNTSISFLNHLRDSQNFYVLRHVRRRLFSIRESFDDAIDTLPIEYQESTKRVWQPWLPECDETRNIIPIDQEIYTVTMRRTVKNTDEVDCSFCWTPESIFDASFCILQQVNTWLIVCICHLNNCQSW